MHIKAEDNRRKCAAGSPGHTFNNVPELDSILAVCATELNNNGENQSALNDSTTAEE